jgi:glycosyltransferase involved in cell wall biosynthesis
VLVASDFNRRVFEKYHASVHRIGLGVEPDDMSPWGPAHRFSGRKIFLSVFRQQYRKAFDVTLKAWIDSGLWKGGCELVAYSPNLDCRKYMAGSGETLRNANFVSVFDKDYNVRYVRPNREIAFSELGRIYRGADFFVLNSRSEGFCLPVVEAMACGVPCVIPNYSATEEFVTAQGCIAIEGKPILADYSDRGFRDVGYWWEPDPSSLSGALRRAAALSETERASMGETGRQHVLSHFTWRHSAARFHEFCRNQLPAVERPPPPIKRGLTTRRFWSRQFRRAALVFELLRQGRIGRVLVLAGIFLQRKGY